MIAIDWNPDRKTLRTFAIGLIVLASAYAIWLGWQQRLSNTAMWGCALFGCVGLVGACVPPLLRWIYVAWMVIVFPIGWCIFQAMLAILFFGVITPLGLLMKFRGRDPLGLKPDPQAQSYWTKRSPSPDPSRHFRQY